MHELYYKQSANEWEEALPLGNGFLGAMIYGGVERETLFLNEDSIWSGKPTDRHNKNAKKSLKEIQKALLEGDYSLVNKLSLLDLTANPETQSHYQPLGEMLLTFGYPDKEGHVDEQRWLFESGSYYFKSKSDFPVNNYSRKLDLNTAMSNVTYEVNDILYERKTFISYPDNVIVMNIKANKPNSLYMCVNITRGQGRYIDKCEPVDNTTLHMSYDSSGGISFCSALRCIATNGTTTVSGQYIMVEGADEITLLLSAATTYRYDNPYDECIKILDKAQTIGIKKLEERHLKDYQQLYNRSSMTVEKKDNKEVATDEMLNRLSEGYEHPELVGLYYNFGRYLMISSSRQGSLPANLQGIWNKEMTPSWDSKYTININTEMNYWATDAMNLGECYEPFFSMLQRLQKNGKVTAQKMYGCRGFMAHHNTDIWADTAPQDACMSSTYWLLGAAWLCTHIYQHYQYTNDTEFLKEYYDMMIDAARFLLDFMVEDKEGNLVMLPSISPENAFRTENNGMSALCAGCIMDAQIIRLLFKQCIKSGEILKKQSSILDDIRVAIEKLAQTKTDDDGKIMEWLEPKEEVEPGHRHMSHLFGLYPSDEISPEKTPDLAQGARKTLDFRLKHGGGHTGWSRAWMINFWARLLDSEKVYENVNLLFTKSSYPSLLDKHPPFQIDGNFGGAAGIVEALVQSHEGYIHLLPALPRGWGNGQIEGLIVRGGHTLSIEFDNGKLVSAKLESASDEDIYIKYQNKLVCTNDTMHANEDNLYFIKAKKGQQYIIKEDV